MYIFKHVDSFTGDEFTMHLSNDDVGWVGLVEKFQSFLRGCSFQFYEGMEFSETLCEKQDELLQARNNSESVRFKKSATSASEKQL